MQERIGCLMHACTSTRPDIAYPVHKLCQCLQKPTPDVIREIEKAILKSDLGLNPQGDGKALRLVMPPLSGEQRTKLVAKVKDLVEQNRVALRNERRDANKQADQMKKDGDMTEDQLKKAHDLIDKALKACEAKLDDALKAKSREILED